MNVVSVRGAGRDARYSLRPEHWRLARASLLGGDRVPAVALAAFFYRDYEIRGTSGRPTAQDLIAVFRHEFGYDDQAAVQGGEFEYLYSDPTDTLTNDHLFEGR